MVVLWVLWVGWGLASLFTGVEFMRHLSNIYPPSGLRRIDVLCALLVGLVWPLGIALTYGLARPEAKKNHPEFYSHKGWYFDGD